jgi:hypothetical protein
VDGGSGPREDRRHRRLAEGLGAAGAARAKRKEPTIEAKAKLHISGDRYEPEGEAAVRIEKRADGYFFSWKARDSEGSDIAEESKLLLFSSMDDPAKPHAYLEQYIRTNIQKTVLKRKNKLKVVGWAWSEK